jgi:serine/threonine-protein kinase PknG
VGSTGSSSNASRRSVSGRLSRTLGSSGTSRSVSVRSARSGSRSSDRGRLGAGLVTVPAVPRPDPAAAVLADPQVPERRRYCSRRDCGAPVGRSRGDRAGRTEGYCTRCGHPYSFTPKLRRGDVVHGQYEVAGCLAHGGLGWIYLAVDRAVSDRWVVLKGLLDTGDEDALAAAVSERRFLAEIEHPNIVRIYNFVEHLDQRTGTLDGYIVMEYVGGKSLRQIADERRTPDGKRDPLPVGQAIAFALEALEALGHLHRHNLLYCDFKVDNALQQEDRLKLIDMGAVRRMDDQDGAIYGTVGYQAPEVAEVGPSVASDLYTVARTLAVLTFDFQGYTSFLVDSLPDPRHIEIFSRYESFYRLLIRATDPDPGRRFCSAQEMADQLTGVLREVVALESGVPRPALSTLFGPELRVVDTDLVPPAAGEVSRLGARPGHRPAGKSRKEVAKGRTATAVTEAPAGSGRAPGVVRLDPCAAVLALPMPQVDPADPNAGLLAGLASAAPAELLAALRTAPAHSVEKQLCRLRAELELGDRDAALGVLRTLRADGLYDDWRVVWHRGMTALATGDQETAALAFDAVYDAFPGECAPKLALGLCAEVLGQLDNAADYYGLVWQTDHSYVSAAFGFARVRLAAGDRADAVRALESVPESSIHYIAARVAAVRVRLRERAPQEPLLEELRAAAVQVEALRKLGVDTDLRERLTTEVLGCALDWVLAGRHGVATGGPAESVASEGNRTLLGSPLTERGLRFGLERSYRALARLARQGSTRIDLVERANRLRPRTWV